MSIWQMSLDIALHSNYSDAFRISPSSSSTNCSYELRSATGVVLLLRTDILSSVLKLSSYDRIGNVYNKDGCWSNIFFSSSSSGLLSQDMF